MKLRVVLLGALGVLISAGLLAAGAARGRLNEHYAGFSEPVTLEYSKGMSGDELAARLEELGIVRSRWAFQLARALRGDSVLMAGEYVFEQPATVWDVLEKLALGRVKLEPLTIPEGLTRFETAQLIADAGYGSLEEVLALTADPASIADLFPEAKSLEGCLYPETYSFPGGTTAAEVIAAMTQSFRRVFEETLATRQGDVKPYDLLIVASMIEKETGVEDERGLVASVYHNRIRRGMLMQCDPTIIYGLILEDRYRGKIYRSDLKDPHPYNTYVHPGLPPGPIASPGRASLEAAVAPAETDYLFFVAEAAGQPGHVFSKTAAEHGLAVVRYRASANEGGQ